MPDVSRETEPPADAERLVPVLGTMTVPRLARARLLSARILVRAVTDPPTLSARPSRLPAYCSCCGCVKRYCICRCCCSA